MGSVFNECGLREVDGDVPIVMALPCEGGAKEEVDITHEVDFALRG